MTPDDLTAGRDLRNRRDRRFAAALTILIVAAVVGLANVQHFGPAASLIGLGLVTALTVGSLYVERADQWQRQRALLTFALGGLAGLLALVVNVVLLAVDAHHATNPLLVLRCFVGVWFASDLALRQWPNIRTHDS